MRSAALLLLVAARPAGGCAGAAAGDQAGGHAGGTGNRTRGVHLPPDPRPRAARLRRSSRPPGTPPSIPPLGWPPPSSARPISALAKFQLDVESAGAVTVILAAGSGARLIVRTVAKGSESGRELPGGPDVVLLDDEVFSLYHSVAELATAGGRTLTAIFPRTGKRAMFTARRESGAAGGASTISMSGDIAGTLVTDGRAGSSGWSCRPRARSSSEPSRTLPQVVIRQRAPMVRRNLKPGRRRPRIGPRSRPHHKGLRP